VSQRSVKAYVQGLLDGLTVQTIRDPLSISVELPSITVPNSPIGWVWISAGRETRFAGSRGTGYKEIDYTLQTIIALDIDPSATDVDQNQFDDLLEGVSYTLRTTSALGVTLTDSVTNRTSDLMNMGEEIEISREEPVALEDQGLLRYIATITTSVKELATG